MGREQAVGILNEMSPDDRTALLEELPPEAVKGLVASLSPSERAVAQNLLGYPERSVGRLMTPDFIAIKSDWTVQQVLDDIRTRGHDSETLNVLYVVDDDGKLIDDLRIREFLTKPLEAKVSEPDERFVHHARRRRQSGKRRSRFSASTTAPSCPSWTAAAGCWALSPWTTCSTWRKRKRRPTRTSSAVSKRRSTCLT